MNPLEQARFNPLYEQMQQALLLQGKRPKTLTLKKTDPFVLRINNPPTAHLHVNF